MRTDSRIAAPSARTSLPRQPLTTAAAGSLGWTRSAQRHAVRTGDAIRIHRGVLVAAPTLDETMPARRVHEQANLRCAQAVALTCARAVISHLSGAVALHIPTYGDLGSSCLTVPKGTELRTLADAHLHRAGLQRHQICYDDGFPVTIAARTVLDLAREGGVEAGIIAVDHVLRHGMASLSDLHAQLAFCTGWPRSLAARESVRLGDPRSESVLESLSRLRILQSRLPDPVPQVLIYDRQGVFIGRTDFYWDALGVVGEADGDSKYLLSGTAVSRQLDRQRRLERTGLAVVRWGWSDMYEFDRVVRLIEQAAVLRRERRPERRAWVAVPT